MDSKIIGCFGLATVLLPFFLHFAENVLVGHSAIVTTITIAVPVIFKAFFAHWLIF